MGPNKVFLPFFVFSTSGGKMGKSIIVIEVLDIPIRPPLPQNFQKNTSKTLLGRQKTFLTLIQMREFPKDDPIWHWSNPRIVNYKARHFYRMDVHRSTRFGKKYMIWDPHNEKWIHFGQMNYEDFTKHGDEDRRRNYLRRTEAIRGNWRDNPYSPNMLSRRLLW